MICVSFGKSVYPELIRQLEQEHLAEIRIDLNNFSNDELSALFSSHPRLIAACRPGVFTEPERIRKLKTAVVSGAAFTDIEYDSDKSSVDEILGLCTLNPSSLIISYHNYKLTPSSSELDELYEKLSEMGADIVKIACTVSSAADNSRIMALYDRTRNSGKPDLIAFGMGEKGRITRVAAPFLGAPFTYASVPGGSGTAEGQMDRSKLEKIYKLIKNEE